jgi:hypothetical protein
MSRPAPIALGSATEPFRRRSCVWKIGYPNGQAAKRAARRIVLRKGGDRLHAYRCLFCMSWHLGHPKRHH